MSCLPGFSQCVCHPLGLGLAFSQKFSQPNKERNVPLHSDKRIIALSERLAHSAVDIHLKEISEFLHTLPWTLNKTTCDENSKVNEMLEHSNRANQVIATVGAVQYIYVFQDSVWLVGVYALSRKYMYIVNYTLITQLFMVFAKNNLLLSLEIWYLLFMELFIIILMVTMRWIMSSVYTYISALLHFLPLQIKN